MLDFVIVGVTGNRKWFKDVPFLWFLFVPYFHWHDVSMNRSSLKYHYKTRITSPRHHMNDILFFSIVDLHLIEVMKSQPRLLGLEDLSNVNYLFAVRNIFLYFQQDSVCFLFESFYLRCLLFIFRKYIFHLMDFIYDVYWVWKIRRTWIFWWRSINFQSKFLNLSNVNSLLEVMKSQPRSLGLEDLSNVNSLMDFLTSHSKFLCL